MAIRPVYEVSEADIFFVKKDIEFEYFNGFSSIQKKRSISSLHKEYLKTNNGKRILEISSKSNEELGIRLSAFNLIITTRSGKNISVESAFQGSKVFERGGPYSDLLYTDSKTAKRDERLKNSGKLIGFQIYDRFFEAEPKTLFYNWLYINTLNLYDNLKEQIIEYDAFTDIEFNPQKSINCQAEAAAIFVSLYRQGKLDEALKGKDGFMKTVYSHYIEEHVNC